MYWHVVVFTDHSAVKAVLKTLIPSGKHGEEPRDCVPDRQRERKCRCLVPMSSWEPTYQSITHVVTVHSTETDVEQLQMAAQQTTKWSAMAMG